MKEVWTTEAKNTFANNIGYLKKKFPKEVLENFIDKSFEVIDLLLQNPKLAVYDKKWKAYKFLIVPQIYLFFEVDGNNFVLISFWNNKQKTL